MAFSAVSDQVHVLWHDRWCRSHTVKGVFVCVCTEELGRYSFLDPPKLQ